MKFKLWCAICNTAPNLQLFVFTENDSCIFLQTAAGGGYHPDGEPSGTVAAGESPHENLREMQQRGNR